MVGLKRPTIAQEADEPGTEEGLRVDLELGADMAKRVKLTTEERRALLDNLDIEGTLLLIHHSLPVWRALRLM